MASVAILALCNISLSLEGKDNMAAAELDKIDEIIDRYAGKEGMLIQLLLDIQNELKWISQEAMERISKRNNIPIGHIYRVVSFYKAMSLNPKGKHIVSVCLGTACHVRGGLGIMDKAKEFLDMKTEGTTPDRKFTLERVNCLGCCALGPVVVVDGEYHGKMTPSKMEETLKRYD